MEANDRKSSDENSPGRSSLDPKVVSRKWQLASDLFEMAFKTKQYQMRKKFSHLSEEEITKKAYELIKKGCA